MDSHCVAGSAACRLPAENPPGGAGSAAASRAACQVGRRTSSMNAGRTAHQEVSASAQVRTLRPGCSEGLRPDGGAALADADAEDRRQTEAGQRIRRFLPDVPAGKRSAASTAVPRLATGAASCSSLCRLSRCVASWRVWSRSTAGRRTGVQEESGSRSSCCHSSANTWSRKRPS